MDKYIEMFVPYLIDWQQTAIDNTRYSVVLAALAFIIGWQLVVLWKRKSIAKLNHQLMEEKQTLEQTELKLEQAGHEHEELLVNQKNDAESIAGLQQQLEQLSENLQESEEKHVEFLKKYEQLTKTLDKKQIDMEALKLDLNDKTHVVEQIQAKLAEQKNLLAQYSSDRAKVEEMEKEISEASSVKQQLLQKESENNEQIKKFEKLQQSAKNSIDRVLELEAQLEKRSQTDESEEPLGQAHLAELNAMKEQLEQEKRNAESKAEYSVDLAHTLQQQNQQLAQFNEKLQVLLTQPQAVTEENTLSNDNDTAKAKGGLVGRILNLVSSLDKVDISDNKQNNEEEEVADEVPVEDVWQKHHRIVDQLIEQLSIQTEVNEHQTIAVENDDSIQDKLNADLAVKSSDTLVSDPSKQANEVIEKTESFQDKPNTDSAVKNSDTLANDSPELMNKVTEKMDDFQDKLKGFYHKFRS